MAKRIAPKPQKIKKEFPYYPFLFALFPILAVLSVNINHTSLAYVFWPAAISLLIGAALYGLFWLIFRRWDKAAIASTWLFLLIFSYGHAFNLIENLRIGSFEVGHHRYLVILWLLLAVGGIFFFLWLLKKLPKITAVLNMIGIFMVILPILFTTISQIKQGIYTRTDSRETIGLEKEQDVQPDVYYIILDQYLRQDMLLINHGYDNSGFIQELRGLGFYVADCSQSNYGLTSFSLASSLNIDFITQINPEAVEKHINWTVFGANIQDNLVMDTFKQAGYKIVTFETGVEWTETKDTDLYISRRSNPLYQQGSSEISDFEFLFWRTTLFRFIEDYNGAFWYKWFFNVKSPDEIQYERILFDLDQLEQVTTVPGPKFVFLHLVSPHSPFVIGPEGQLQVELDHATGYLNQVSFLDQRLPGILQAIISNSAVEPIIIIQSDHGDEPEERLAILNAYYLPSGGDALLYPDITPVNTFRLVFNHYFGQKLPLLSDTSYYSMYEGDYYNFEEIKYDCTPSQ